ncbi:MAG: hypothetical protein ACOYXM_06185 [Actinomycetota bacterium]
MLGAAIAVALVGAAVALVAQSFDSGPEHPDEWDPRVIDLAEFVEDERSLEFDHPVYVDFLTPAEYTEQTTEDEEALADDERAELARYAGELRAFGLGSGEIDLFDAFNAVSDSGTLAFYDTVEERVKVRGTELTVGLRVTLVHELTHALQHQHFDIEALYDDELDSSASTALRSLIEGDALRIEEAYTSGELTAEEQAEYDEEYAEELEASEASTADVPPFISASFSVPYLLGQPFVLMLANEGGNRAVDDAFESPPDTEEHLFDPASFLAGEDGKELDLDLDDDIEVLDDGPFGSPTWYLMLAERIDPKVAFEATLGWTGDAYATFKRGGRSCVRAAFAGDSSGDEEEMSAALSEWAAAMPGGMAEAIEIDGHPGLESCDPGEDVDLELSGRSGDALFLPSLWGYLVADAATALDADGARCYATEVLAGLTYEQIVDPEGAAFAGDDFQQSLSEAFESCV